MKNAPSVAANATNAPITAIPAVIKWIARGAPSTTVPAIPAFATSVSGYQAGIDSEVARIKDASAVSSGASPCSGTSIESDQKGYPCTTIPTVSTLTGRIVDDRAAIQTQRSCRDVIEAAAVATIEPTSTVSARWTVGVRTR